MPDPSTILLVDDEDSVQKLLAYPLERDGFRVRQARDGEEALARFAREEVDLVVLDLMLPKLDGLEVCKRLRATSTVPIIMLTARDDELDKVVGVELGGKPVQLTYVEFELLRTMASRPGHVFTRARLLEALWGDSAYREQRTIDVHVRHLREKLEPEPHEPRFIHTVRGVGYRFREP